MTWYTSVVFPDASGPKISTTRPRGKPADAERHVECQRAGRDRADGDLRTIAHPHHRPLAEISLDLAERDVERFLAFHGFILPNLRFLNVA